MSKPITEKIENKAIELLKEAPEGLRYSELCKKVKEAIPEANPNTIRGETYNLHNKYKEIYKPRRGLFKHVNYKTDEEIIEKESTKYREKEVIYAIKVADLTYSGLKILDVKIGKTSNINLTLAQYKRSSRSIEILDLWETNKTLSLASCENGVQKLAEKYAYERDNEKFIFLQQSYDSFSENVSLLLKKTTKGE